MAYKTTRVSPDGKTPGKGQQMTAREIPVYLFTGFLDAGKTSFIQETLEDPQFNSGEKTLILMCEEGEEELRPLAFASSNVKTVKIEDEEELTTEYLAELQRTVGFDRVVVEYNGMWMLDDFYNTIPANWVVYQEMNFTDARTFLTYNANMRNLVYDKMKSPEAIVFKHFDDSMDKMEFHKIVRAANRRCQIIYEYSADRVEFDNIEDPLPYDMDAPVLEIKDENYAIWYADINEEESKYYGKTLKIKGRALTQGGLEEDEIVIGRHIMTCCVEDIQFGGLVAKYAGAKGLTHGEWVIITAEVKNEYNHMYQGNGPVLHVTDLEKTDVPEQEVATFY